MKLEADHLLGQKLALRLRSCAVQKTGMMEFFYHLFLNETLLLSKHDLELSILDATGLSGTPGRGLMFKVAILRAKEFAVAQDEALA